MDSLVTLITTVSTSTSRCGNNFCATGWQFYTDILKGVDIPAGKKIKKCEKGDFQKIFQEDFFVAIWQETPKDRYLFLCVKGTGSGISYYVNFVVVVVVVCVHRSSSNLKSYIQKKIIYSTYRNLLKTFKGPFTSTCLVGPVKKQQQQHREIPPLSAHKNVSQPPLFFIWNYGSTP